MNCINHPETPVSAFCQHCGKPLCAQCFRTVQGVVYCEQCLAEKLNGAPGFGTSGYTVNIGAPGSNFQYSQSGPLPPGGLPNRGFPDRGPNPSLAGFLGFIPGVAAMYNGQFVKALVHVLVFVVLVSLAHAVGIFGICIGAWVLYQVFDGYQTAKARRDGLPLPDPFGLNDLGSRMSGTPPGNFRGGNFQPGNFWTPTPPTPGASGFTDQGIGGSQTTSQAAGFGQSGFGQPAGFTSQPVNPQPGAASQPDAPPYAGYPPYTAVPPDPSAPPPGPPFGPPGTSPPLVPRRSEPVGAIVLIGLGLLFLFSTTGLLSFRWIAHGWPLVLIAVGAWMVVKQVIRIK